MNIIWWILGLSVLSGVLNFEGREGGCWYKSLWVARTGVTLAAILSLAISQGPSLWLLSLVLLWGALTLGDFGKFYWSVQGFAVALAFGFWACGMHHILLWMIQLSLVTILTYLWSRSWFGSLKFWSSFGRGFIYCVSTLLYLIPDRLFQ